MTEPRVHLRPEIAAMVPYRQGKPAAADAFKLSSNENHFEPLPAVREAIAAGAVNRYPDATAAELRNRLAAQHGVTPEQIQVGAGSVSVLAQLITAAASVGDEVVYAWRSFEAYPGLVTVAGATNVAVPNTPEHRHDLDAMAAAITERTRLVIVCSPNNPTGAAVTAVEFADFMAKVPSSVLVVLDEAYIEFVTDDSIVRGIPLLTRYPNLVVLRTFSKAYGLAGLRIGYAVGPEYVMDAARSAAIPLSVIDQAQKAALVSLDHEDELLDRVATIARLRDTVWHAVTDLGLDVPRPHGNFLWVPTDFSTGSSTGADGTDTAVAARLMAEHGIVARALGEGVRISIAEPESVDRLLAGCAALVDYRKNFAVAATVD